MNNVKSVISRHNKRVLRETKSEESTNDNNIEKLCNCRNVNECPLNNMCLTKDLVYQAEVKTKDNNDIKTYIGKRQHLRRDTEITRNHSMILNTRMKLNFPNMFGN